LAIGGCFRRLKNDCPPQKLNDPHAARARRLYSW
jgi:hypothetical protein